MIKVAFLDRDGTINKDYDDNDWKYINNPEILDGNIEGLKKLKSDGYEIIIITNQYIIADGIISEKQYEEFNRKLIELLKKEGIDILKIYYCPHNDLDNCDCKKPKTGMIDNALNDFDIDLAKSFYIGDNYNDYELAKKFNLDFYGIIGKNNDNIFKYNNILEVINEMKKIKIIAMDFDGTLLTSDKQISNRTQECLMKVKDMSYIIIGVTARNLLSVKDVLNVNLFDYIILNNGSDIYYVKEDRIENISSIENEIVEKIYSLFNNISTQIDFCTPYKYLIKTKEKSDNRSVVKYIDGLDDVDSSVSRMNVFFENEKDLEENRGLLEKEFSNISVVKMIDTDDKNSRIWLTINPKNANKLTTLKKICNDLNSTIEEVIFFGDGENDLVLIENVGIGVAMENAIDIVKEKADFVTLSNDNDGIVEYLEKNM